jgi:hypothetical protein
VGFALDPNNPGVAAPTPSDQVRDALEHRRIYEAIAWMAFAQSPVATLDTFTKGVQSFQQTFPNQMSPLRMEIYEILGAAHLVRLKLDKARQFFLGAGRQDLLKNVLAVALRHGQFAVVKDFLKEGAISRADYEDFLRNVALPRFPLHFHPQKGFYLDEKELFALLKQLPDTPEECLEQAVKLMEQSGDLNFVKKFIFANYAKNQRLIAQYSPAFNALAGRNRKDIPKMVEEFCDQAGVTIKKMIQEGDLANYFPKSSFLFLVSRNANDVRVWKEQSWNFLPSNPVHRPGLSNTLVALKFHRKIWNYLRLSSRRAKTCVTSRYNRTCSQSLAWSPSLPNSPRCCPSFTATASFTWTSRQKT